MSDLTVRVLDTEEMTEGPVAQHFAKWGVVLQRSIVSVGPTQYSVIVGHEPCVDTVDLRWHVSVAGLDDVPQWNHLVAIVHHMRAGVVFAVPLPPLSWWLNENEHCLHVWEIRDDNLIRSWREDARGDKPT